MFSLDVPLTARSSLPARRSPGVDEFPVSQSNPPSVDEQPGGGAAAALRGIPVGGASAETAEQASRLSAANQSDDYLACKRMLDALTTAMPEMIILMVGSKNYACAAERQQSIAVTIRELNAVNATKLPETMVEYRKIIDAKVKEKALGRTNKKTKLICHFIFSVLEVTTGFVIAATNPILGVALVAHGALEMAKAAAETASYVEDADTEKTEQVLGAISQVIAVCMIATPQFMVISALSSGATGMIDGATRMELAGVTRETETATAKYETIRRSQQPIDQTIKKLVDLSQQQIGDLAKIKEQCSAAIVALSEARRQSFVE